MKEVEDGLAEGCVLGRTRIPPPKVIKSFKVKH